MPDRRRPLSEEDNQNEDRPSFEDVVAAALRVDPTGIAGKHRKAQPESDSDSDR